MRFLKKKRSEKLRRLWGKEIDKHRNFDLISSCHNLLKSEGIKPSVDDKTWNDLDFNSIFCKMDRNISGIGQQYLYHQLHTYENDENILIKNFDLATQLKEDQALREKIQLKLFGLTGISAYFVAYLVLSKSLPKAKYYPLFYLCSLLSVISLILISFNGIFFFVALAILTTNLILNKIFSKRIYEFFTGFSGLNSLIISAISISKLKTDLTIDEIEFLKQKRGLLTSIKKKLGLSGN